MKKATIISVLLFCAATGVFAQKQSGPLPYNKERLDSLFNRLPGLNQPFALPVPEGYSFPDHIPAENPKRFESLNPGVTFINQTKRGSIYNMPSDNMAVLVPDMRSIEKMPGSNPVYSQALPNNMPNPLQPKKPMQKK